MANSQAVTKHRQKRKLELIKIMGNKCALCGYNKAITALEFHHINPEEKSYWLSSGNCKTIEEDLNEAKKCILVCANCHREIHEGLINEKLKSSYDEEIANEILSEYQQKKTRTKKYCLCCGKEIDIKATYCVNCFNKLRANPNKPTRQELKTEIRILSFVKIGEKYGVSDNCVRDWCVSYDLPSKKKDIVRYSDQDWEKI